MTEYNGGGSKAEHLCVLVHGLWGNPQHMKSIAAALRGQFDDDKLYILVVKSNSGYFTYDGVEVGGERVCLEIEETLAAAEKQGGHISRISVIGYSLGGLVARYAVGLLHAKGVLDRLECMNFTAFSSPFLGVRSPLQGVQGTFWNTIGARTLSVSGRQLFGVDRFRDTGRPLLAVLADPGSIFMAGLARFRRRTLYANIVNDRSAPYFTTAIAATDPYADARADGGEMTDLALRFLPGYGDVLLDPHEPVGPQTRRQHQRLRQRNLLRQKEHGPAPLRVLQALVQAPFSSDARAVLAEFAPAMAIMALLPIALPAFLATSAYQTVQSRKRLELHERGQAGIDVAQYRVPLWIQSLRETMGEVVEEAVEGAAEAYGQLGHLQEQMAGAGTHPAEEDVVSSPSTSSLLAYRDDDGDDDHVHGHNNKSRGGNETDSEVSRSATPSTPSASSALSASSRGSQQGRRRSSWTPSATSADAEADADPDAIYTPPTLALAPEQFDMIEALDNLGWRKYPVWIHKVGHSHAAIVVRHQTERFSEGRTVLRHFVQEEFLL